jgi:hypothetical protein
MNMTLTTATDANVTNPDDAFIPGYCFLSLLFLLGKKVFTDHGHTRKSYSCHTSLFDKGSPICTHKVVLLVLM